ncbi:hypothetical protein M4D70_19080 [Brevibacillus borstelensis]|uniref:hypothetical protein n=1 Tax=Brevibacillus borstelensis TaxID=45462 RepID=UPI0020424FFC|nr:hypothetical protein [Brevibacillus borstelensis]MCM3624333.1 hypothetical protein [Brevibacillus borstelensis]
MSFFGGLFGGGGFLGGSGGIREKNPFEREAERRTRKAVEKVATKLSPTLGNVVKVVNEVQEAKDDLIYGKQPSLKEIFDDNKKTVKNFTPAYGALVYCELGFGSMEHSGIYVGGNRIIDLDGKGNIKKVSLNEFTSHISTVDTEIWVPCDKEGNPIGLSYAGDRAVNMLGGKRDYNLILDNCHQFASGCITGNFENADNFLWMLKDTFAKTFRNSVVWKKWEWHKR